jgi:hypothetical protein
MRSWLVLLGGLLLWAAHFFTLYAIGEFVHDGGAARLAVGLLTIVLFVADLLLFLWIRRRRRSGFSQWRDQVGMLGAALAAIAIVWQGLPALLVAGVDL